ncbi:hypothetical protein N9L47_00095 [Rhodobacteraceae bacterium]|nr:hypothetical protein [Paracoccaceae bacterium]
MSNYDATHDAPATFFLAHGAARALGIWNDNIAVTEVDYGLYTPTYSVILSNEAWAQVSEEDKAAILEISGEKLAHRSASWDAFDNGFRSDMVANGLKRTKAGPALIANLQENTNEGVLD